MNIKLNKAKLIDEQNKVYHDISDGIYYSEKCPKFDDKYGFIEHYIVFNSNRSEDKNEPTLYLENDNEKKPFKFKLKEIKLNNDHSFNHTYLGFSIYKDES